MTNSIALSAVLLVASWERFGDAGKLAANGNKFDPLAMTCATWQFPLGTHLHIVERLNRLSVDVIVTDRTARRFSNRVDLSPAAFEKLDGLGLGVCDVEVTEIKAGSIKSVPK